MGRLAQIITKRLITILEELLICRKHLTLPSPELDTEYKDAVLSVHLLYFYQSPTIESIHINYMINTIYGLLEFLRPKIDE